jgi:hypothetical protein
MLRIVIGRCAGKGRGLVATADLVPGQLLLVTPPIALVEGDLGDIPDHDVLLDEITSGRVRLGAWQAAWLAALTADGSTSESSESDGSGGGGGGGAAALKLPSLLAPPVGAEKSGVGGGVGGGGVEFRQLGMSEERLWAAIGERSEPVSPALSCNTRPSPLLAAPAWPGGGRLCNACGAPRAVGAPPATAFSDHRHCWAREPRRATKRWLPSCHHNDATTPLPLLPFAAPLRHIDQSNPYLCPQHSPTHLHPRPPPVHLHLCNFQTVLNCYGEQFQDLPASLCAGAPLTSQLGLWGPFSLLNHSCRRAAWPAAETNAHGSGAGEGWTHAAAARPMHAALFAWDQDAYASAHPCLPWARSSHER